MDGGEDRTNRNLDGDDRTNRNLDGEDRTNRTWTSEELNEWEREFVSEHCDLVSRKKSLDLEKELAGYERLPIMDSSQQDQSAINQEQQEKMSKMEESMQEMKQMMAMFLQQMQSPRNIPLPETPAPQQGPSLQFATSTPQTVRTVGLDTTIRGVADSLLDTPVPTPESSNFRQKEEIKLPDEKKGIMLDTRKVNLHFDGSEVEIFIKRVEKVASMHGAGGQDVALQLPFMIRDKKISEAIENMEGHKSQDWELLKKELIRKWGRATPLRRYDESSIPNLVSKYTAKGGIQTKEDYRTFISDLEEILAYLKKMGYENVNADSGNPLWNAISAEMRRDVAKELAHDKNLRQTKDGKGLIPKLDDLKDYVEALWWSN